MTENLFKKYPVHHEGKMFEIRVYKDEQGSKVFVYLDDELAFPHGYFCDEESDRKYKQMFGKTGWQRLVFCAKADIKGKKRFSTGIVSSGIVSTSAATLSPELESDISMDSDIIPEIDATEDTTSAAPSHSKKNKKRSRKAPSEGADGEEARDSASY